MRTDVFFSSSSLATRSMSGLLGADTISSTIFALAKSSDSLNPFISLSTALPFVPAFAACFIILSPIISS
ncbi:MAG: hypothetical protein A4E57_02460 [Syntrophorhabdaceae bacterium PtaU1.Bin034]|nr:MAG: hypothetical protein A4E57_02460 [Syntrophorhabdaceae bacterium PtaU1.Bin034]